MSIQDQFQTKLLELIAEYTKLAYDNNQPDVAQAIKVLELNVPLKIVSNPNVVANVDMQEVLLMALAKQVAKSTDFSDILQTLNNKSILGLKLVPYIKDILCR